MEELPVREEADRVGKLLCNFLRAHITVEFADDFDRRRSLILKRADVIAAGISEDGLISDDFDDIKVDELLDNAIDPSLN